MVNLVESIGYDNFKNEVQSVQGKQRSNLYGRLWSELYELQLDPDRFEWDSSTAIEKMAVQASDAYGVALVSTSGQVLLRKASGGFGGFCWTFPKGQPDGYESPQETAKRELFEETGFHCRLIGLLPRRYKGSTGSTVFFVGAPVGNQQPFGSETEETRWASIQDAHDLISLTTNPIGRDRDQMVLCDLYRWLSARQKH
jgi:8-oxo-dGTP pyrophosphatase MutT (NUDIX family)